VFDNRVQRRIFEPKREKVTIGRRKLHNEEIYTTYSTKNTIRVIKLRMIKWAKPARERRERYTKFRSENSEGKRIFGRPRHRWRAILE
jgi:hypothetical protein